VTQANHVVGTQLGVAPCNGTDAQLFWMAGPTIKMASTFSHLTTNPSQQHRECLDVLFDNEVAGATLDDSDCNGTNAARVQLDRVAVWIADEGQRDRSPAACGAPGSTSRTTRSGPASASSCQHLQREPGARPGTV
jgi:hypothetical protein